MKIKRLIPAIAAGLLATTMLAGAPATSQAADMFQGSGAVDPWSNMGLMVRLRAIGVVPVEDDGRLGGAPVSYDVSEAVMPELDITYFLTDNIAAELILGVTPHKVDLAGTGKITELWLLPPTLTFQYHVPMGAFKPYFGLGVNYTIILDSDATAAIGGVDKWQDHMGFAIQAGFDYALNDTWSINVDVKKLFLNMSANVTAGNVPATVDIDPWIFGAGVGYRF